MLRVCARPLSALADEQVEQIHRASLGILEEVGVEICGEEALALLARAGAEVDEATRRVRLPRGLVETALRTAPRRFTLQARNPARSVEVGGESIALFPVSGPTMARDLVGGRRRGTYGDLVNFVKLAQQSPLLDAAYRCVEAADLPPATRHLDYLHAVIRYTDKPVLAVGPDATQARDALALAALLFGGYERLRRQPSVMIVVNVDSPLRFGAETVATIVAFARAGQPVQITPFVLPGIMAPVTTAGALAQQNAENLAGITLAQIVNPGVPVVYGSFAVETDMRTAAPVFGTGRGVLLEVAAGQMAQRYGLPHRAMGLLCTARTPDAQAAWEKMNCLWALALSHTHVLPHAAGWLEGGLTADYEQFVLDLEMLAGLAAFLAGFPVDAESLALETIAAVGPGGNYLMAEHTLAHYRQVSHLSPLVDSRAYDAWWGDGARSPLQRANALWRRRLTEYEEPPLDPGLHEAVRDYVRRRQRGERQPLA